MEIEKKLEKTHEATTVNAEASGDKPVAEFRLTALCVLMIPYFVLAICPVQPLP